MSLHSAICMISHCFLIMGWLDEQREAELSSPLCVNGSISSPGIINRKKTLNDCTVREKLSLSEIFYGQKEIGKISAMAAFNPSYDSIGKAFSQQYYNMFDNPTSRGGLLSIYHPQDSLMTFEGQQCQGAAKILEKFQSLTFQKIQHVITSMDCQPMFDGGVLVNVIGQLKTDDDPPLTFSQTFVLKPAEGSFYCQHDIFRLGIHNA